MICKKCGNKNGFLVMVTDYKPLELWEFDEGALTRYCQKDAGDMEMNLQCGVCGSDDIDAEGFDMSMYTDRPLVILSDGEWGEKTDELKQKEEEKEKEEEAKAEAEEEESGEEKEEEENGEEEAEKGEEEKEEGKEEEKKEEAAGEEKEGKGGGEIKEEEK